MVDEKDIRDIFAETNIEKETSELLATPELSAPTNPLLSGPAFERPWWRKTWLVWSGIVVVLGVGVWWIMPAQIQKEPVKPVPAESPVVQELQTPQEVSQFVPIQDKDTDGDGLFDQEEKEAGTLVTEKDTDHDGLSDFMEVKIYGTNPLDADTDKDMFTDGQEVQSGYNPKGDGKLLDLQKALQKIQ